MDSIPFILRHPVEANTVTHFHQEQNQQQQQNQRQSVRSSATTSSVDPLPGASARIYSKKSSNVVHQQMPLTSRKTNNYSSAVNIQRARSMPGTHEHLLPTATASSKHRDDDELMVMSQLSSRLSHGSTPFLQRLCNESRLLRKSQQNLATDNRSSTASSTTGAQQTSARPNRPLSCHESFLAPSDYNHDNLLTATRSAPHEKKVNTVNCTFIFNKKNFRWPCKFVQPTILLEKSLPKSMTGHYPWFTSAYKCH